MLGVVKAVTAVNKLAQNITGGIMNDIRNAKNANKAVISKAGARHTESGYGGMQSAAEMGVKMGKTVTSLVGL